MFLWNIIAIFIDFRFRFRWSVPLELSLWVYLGVTILRDQPQGAKVLRIEANLEQNPIDPNNIMTLIWYICFWGGRTKNTYLGKFEFWNVDISGLFHPTPSLGTLSKIFPLFSDVFLTKYYIVNLLICLLFFNSIFSLPLHGLKIEASIMIDHNKTQQQQQQR